ncbi:cytochrome p450 [Moniliophthora roreri MCA 2997]|uniref:Cytochrome p450 n=2 Tax=Moniliophthora roreri TaxID=221103 RepID=V2XJD9_MONRO|nr:cytochrome p450 [Moniliophthora roreri MCA 2997]KAI3615288.1 cytochrome p450 [Moniliophthora roreri]
MFHSLSLPFLVAPTGVVLAGILVYYLFILPRVNPLRRLGGPPVKSLFANHLYAVLDPAHSPLVYENFVKKYGRSIRIRGVGPWDDRLLTLDPLSLSHVLKNTQVYEKPWQSRKLITSLIGEGMLSAEGQTHKRQRRVATPAFSIQNMRALVPLVFRKGEELKDKWAAMLDRDAEKQREAIVDVCHWVSRATFDVIGLAGFDYNFNAIQDETNELFVAYKEMFEVAISQSNMFRTLMTVYIPYLNKLFPDKIARTVERCQSVIRRVAGHLIQEKKRKIADGIKSGYAYEGKDLLTLLLKSNDAVDLPPEHRISDEDILNNINTFMFAGSDTSSLTVTWLLYLLATHPDTQSRLRDELLPLASSSELEFSEEEIQSIYEQIAELPYLHNVVREALRLIPPVHSSIRVATRDDLVPTMYPVGEDKRHQVLLSKGSFVHVSVEAFNLDKEVWGEDAWVFNPDRWEKLPNKVLEQPGLFSNILTFSAGPRSCIGMRFSMIEIKAFVFILLTNFAFKPTDDHIIKANVVLTRPYIKGRFSQGSQLPLIIERYDMPM